MVDRVSCRRSSLFESFKSSPFSFIHSSSRWVTRYIGCGECTAPSFLVDGQRGAQVPCYVVVAGCPSCSLCAADVGGGGRALS